MKVLVTTKSAIDYQVKVVTKPDHSGVQTDGVQMSMNPFDAIAVEACVSLQEANLVKESTVLTIGDDDTVLRQALAMGINHACQIQANAQDPYQKAHLLAQHIKDNDYDLILMGKLGIDGDHAQIPPMLAGILDWPCATFASKIEQKDQKLIISRETDDGISTVSLKTPCVVSCDLRLNTPRFVALPKLLQAKNVPITQISDLTPKDCTHTILKVTEPPIKKGNPPTEDLDDFIQKLLDGGIIK